MNFNSASIGRWIGRLLLAFFALALLCAAAGWFWLAAKPREVAALTPILENGLNPKDERFFIDIGASYVSAGDWSNPVRFRLQNIELLTRENEVAAKIPALEVTLNLLQLLRGRIVPERIVVLSPSLRVVQDRQGRFYLGTEGGAAPIALREIFLRDKQPQAVAGAEPESASQASTLFDAGIKELSVSKAALTFDSELEGVHFSVPSAFITLKEQKGIFRGRIDIETSGQAGEEFASPASQEGAGGAMALHALFSLDPRINRLELESSFQRLDLSQFADLDVALGSLRGVKLPLSGEISADMTLPLTVHSLQFRVASEAGTVEFPGFFAERLALDALELKGSVGEGMETASIERVYVKTGKTEIEAKAEIQGTLTETPGIKGELSVANTTAKTVKRLWPLHAAENARNWVVQSIRRATVPQAKFRFDMMPEVWKQDSLPSEAIHGEIRVEGATIAYLPKYPEIRNAAGVLTLTGNSFGAEIKKAEALEGIHLSGEASLLIPSLVSEETQILLELPLQAPLADVMAFLQATPYKLSSLPPLERNKIEGAARVSLSVEIIDRPSPAEDGVSFSLEGEVEKAAYPQLYAGLDLMALSGAIKANDSTFSFEGSGEINRQPARLQADIGKDRQSLAAQAVLNSAALAGMGLEVEPYLSGDISVDARWTQQGTQSGKIQLTAELSRALVNIEQAKLVKQPGQPGKIEADLRLESALLKADRFSVTLPQGVVQGELAVSWPQGVLQEVVIRQCRLAGNRLTATYRPLQNGHYLRMQAETLDLAPWFPEEKEQNEQPASPPAAETKAPVTTPPPLPDLDIAASAKQIVLGPKRSLSNIKAALQCRSNSCSKLDVQGQSGDQPFFARIGPQKGRRIFTAYAPNLGALLRTLNILEDMHKGELRAMGIFQDGLPGKPLIGRIELGEHRLGNIPVLAKLLTVATFTGIVDGLTGKGLLFQRAIVPFKFENYVLTLKDAKTAGPSVGITADGPVDFWNDRIDLRGTVVPAYMFNKILSSIPLIGNVYGALAGDGLVAVRYDMTGQWDDPRVSVNPLSALTPGFLRGFFDIFNPVTKQDAESSARTGDMLDAFGKDIDAIEMQLPDFTQPSAPMPSQGKPPVTTSTPPPSVPATKPVPK